MAFAPTKGKKHLGKATGGLSLTSMMDMMTIILLFLLKSYSTSGALLQSSPLIDLPFAQRSVEPETALSILVNNDLGVIKGEGDKSSYKELKPSDMLANIDELNNPESIDLPGLENYLVDNREIAESLPSGFSGKITIQCDSTVTYDWLIKIIGICGKSKYNTLDFVVLKKP